MKRSLRIEKTYPHPPAKVWKAITSRDALAQWLMDNDFVLELGHRFSTTVRRPASVTGSGREHALRSRPGQAFSSVCGGF